MAVLAISSGVFSPFVIYDSIVKVNISIIFNIDKINTKVNSNFIAILHNI